VHNTLLYGSTELIKNEKSSTTATSLKQAIHMYQRHGAKIVHIHRDGQFEQIKKFFLDTPININVTGRNEHIPTVEWHI